MIYLESYDTYFRRYEGKASDYYNDFRTNDESLRMAPLMQMSKLTKNILGADYERARIIRKNYEYLDARLGEMNALKLTRPTVCVFLSFLCREWSRNERGVVKIGFIYHFMA